LSLPALREFETVTGRCRSWSRTYSDKIPSCDKIKE